MTLSKALYILALLMPMVSHSAIQPDRTRIVFNSNEKASSLKLENQSKKFPYLAYSWIENEQGQKEDRYFSALPPIQRLEPGTLTQVRIVKQANVTTLPTDRESLFYFNVREIPPEPENNGNTAIVQLAVQSRLKLFWRPGGIKKKHRESMSKNRSRHRSRPILCRCKTPQAITLRWHFWQR